MLDPPGSHVDEAFSCWHLLVIVADHLEAAVRDVFRGSPAGTWDESELRRVVDGLVAMECVHVAEKLREKPGARVAHKLGDLMAELYVAEALSVHLGRPVTFQVGDAADLRFSVGGVDCLVEVVHKSSPHPWSAVFSPDPADIPHLATGPAWRRPAHQLHSLLQTLPVEIHPWVGSEFLKECVGHAARKQQEEACGAAADWLAKELPGAVQRGDRQLKYPSGDLRFDIVCIDRSPGYMCGFGPLDAWFGEDGTLGQSVLQKAKKARTRLTATGARCYVIATNVEDVIASDGTELQGVLLGPHVVSGTPGARRSFRSVPPEGQQLFVQAQQAGRHEMLQLANFDPAVQRSYADLGLFFDPRLEAVSAVLARYYTGTLQLVPNPFSSTDVTSLGRQFPTLFAPFSPNG